MVRTHEIRIFIFRIFFLISSFIFLISHCSFATHNKAGEIIFKHISGLTYEATVITYTDSSAPADRPQIEIGWGDGSGDTLPRSNGIDLDGDGFPDGEYIGSGTKYNLYVGTHTYSGPDIYIISFEDPNRVDNIFNIPNSVNVPFYVETALFISADSSIGINNSPVLLYPPIDNGCVGQIFIHNPNAYDPDGDSLSYKLVICKGTGGNDISGYNYPTANSSFTLNATTGDLIWNAPQQIGIYSVAMHIEEWRTIKGKATKIGYVRRDMLIIITACNNNPPVIVPVADVCAIAGDTISFNVQATDPNNDKITLSATGKPLLFTTSPAQFPTVTGTGTVTGKFTWETACEHIRKQPYQVLFKAEDNGLQVSLSDLKTVNITIIGPAPQNPTATPLGNSITLYWDVSSCPQATGYKIYRRNGFYNGSIPCPCTTGVPDNIGYSLIATLDGLNNNTFTDNDNGIGLIHGVDYCYIIVATYPDGAESCASMQVCSQLKKDLPVITNVDIKITDVVSGSVYVAWSKPTELDTIQFPGPYKYLIYRSNDFFGNNFTLIDSTGTINGLNDTTFTDNHTPLNTANSPYSYRIDFYNDVPNRFHIGETQTASSVFLTISPTDNLLKLKWEEHVPWDNFFYIIYRKNPTTSLFDSIASSTIPQYADLNLANDSNYCYQIKSIGQYSVSGFVNPIINFSEEKCAVPKDNILPCSPLLIVYPDCINFKNYLVWNDPNSTCSDDVLGYKVYYTPTQNGDFELIATINSPTDTSFLHDNLIQSIAGCYIVTAFDSVGNESQKGTPICVDNCPEYQLPNIFTPDESGLNDLFHPFPYRFVKDVNIKIYNRWGLEIFSTNNPDVNWDGKNQQTKKDCPDGVYYYVCDVHSIYLEGIKTKTLKGFVHLIRGK